MKYGVLIFMVFISFFAFGQQLNWVKFSDLNDSLKINPKKVIIKIETSWCGYCKMMDAKVFNTKKTVKKLKGDYYFVRLNAEGKEPVVFRNNEYQPGLSKR